MPENKKHKLTIISRNANGKTVLRFHGKKSVKNEENDDKASQICFFFRLSSCTSLVRIFCFLLLLLSLTQTYRDGH
jgi:hypothetical protein